MYINIGKNSVVLEEEILGIFDLDTCAQSGITKRFFQNAEKEIAVINAAEDIPNAFLLCRQEDRNLVFLTQSPAKTIYKRMISPTGRTE